MIFQSSMELCFMSIFRGVFILRYLPSKKKENHLQKCLCGGYLSSWTVLYPSSDTHGSEKSCPSNSSYLYSQLTLNHDYGRNSKDLTQPEKKEQFGRVLRDAIPMKKITLQDSDWWIIVVDPRFVIGVLWLQFMLEPVNCNDCANT